MESAVHVCTASVQLDYLPAGNHRTGHDNDDRLALQHEFHPKLPYVYFPGTLGSVETNMAVADGVVYVPS